MRCSIHFRLVMALKRPSRQFLKRMVLSVQMSEKKAAAQKATVFSFESILLQRIRQNIKSRDQVGQIVGTPDKIPASPIAVVKFNQINILEFLFHRDR